MPERAAEQILRTTFGFEGVPARAGRDRRCDIGRPRCARGDADRKRQVALLSAAGAAARRPDDRRVAADRADAQSGGAASRLWRRRRALNSANDAAENWAILDRIARGDLRLLYIAPERLVKAETIDLLKRARIALLAVDEAHCISQWGHDFRPEYAALGAVQAELGDVQTVAFTATADAATRYGYCG